MSKDRKEKLEVSKIVFFDADKTLWRVDSKRQDDWASRIENPTFELAESGVVKRKEDGTKFFIKEGVLDVLHNRKTFRDFWAI